MTYDLAVWEGRRPWRGRAAGKVFERLMGQLEAGQPLPPPTPAIAGFVTEALSVWPDLGSPGDDASPWASGPLIGEAFGSAVYLPLTFSSAPEAVPVLGRIARSRALVCYDPQTERLV